MITRKLKETQFNNFTNAIIKTAHCYPMVASYDVDVIFNHSKYVLKIQFDKHCTVIALQAISIIHNKVSNDYVLITDNCILIALLDLLIYQIVNEV